jgi:hypothetical protein
MVLPIVNSNGGNVQIGKSMTIEPRRLMSPVKRRRRDSSVLPSRSIQATLLELLGAPATDAATMTNEEEPQEFPENTEEMEPSVPEDSGPAAMEQNDTQEFPEEPKAYQNRPLKKPTSNLRPATVLVLKAKKSGGAGISTQSGQDGSAESGGELMIQTWLWAQERSNKGRL